MRSRFRVGSISTLLATLLFLCSCSKKPRQTLFPAGSPMADSIHFLREPQPSCFAGQKRQLQSGLRVERGESAASIFSMNRVE
jgi:hypothetical protein